MMGPPPGQLFADPYPDRVPLADQIAEVERELRMRARVYPRMIASNRMSQGEAEGAVKRLRAVLITLRNAKVGA